jgi:hypothetical protein
MIYDPGLLLNIPGAWIFAHAAPPLGRKSLNWSSGVPAEPFPRRLELSPMNHERRNV